MSYQMRISPRSSKAGRFITRVHKELQRVFVRSGLTQQELATKLDVNRATVNKRLLGTENLTLRSIADMAWALDADIRFDLTPRADSAVGNFYQPSTSSAPSPATTTPAVTTRTLVGQLPTSSKSASVLPANV